MRPADRPLGRVDHDEELHDRVVHGVGEGLDDEDVLLADVLLILHKGVVIGELGDANVAKGHFQVCADILSQSGVRVAAEHLHLLQVRHAIPSNRFGKRARRGGASRGEYYDGLKYSMGRGVKTRKQPLRRAVPQQERGAPRSGSRRRETFAQAFRQLGRGERAPLGAADPVGRGPLDTACAGMTVGVCGCGKRAGLPAPVPIARAHLVQCFGFSARTPIQRALEEECLPTR